MPIREEIMKPILRAIKVCLFFLFWPIITIGLNIFIRIFGQRFVQIPSVRRRIERLKEKQDTEWNRIKSIFDKPMVGGVISAFAEDYSMQLDEYYHEGHEWSLIFARKTGGVAKIDAGYLKTFRPIMEIAPTIFWAPSLPEPLVRFIGISELLGAVGLILPALLKIRPQLTTMAAAALTLVMFVANVFHIVRGELFVLPMTLAFLFVAAFIAYGRWKLSPFVQSKDTASSGTPK
jgi:hypothetical protein